MSDKDFETLLNTETGNMNAKEFKQFMKKLIKAVEEKWDDYVVMECSSPDIAVARVCEECGNPRLDDRYYFSLSDEVSETIDEEGYEDYLGIEDVFEAVNMDDCMCETDE